MMTTAHAVLRDRLHWRGSMRGLTIARDGSLALSRVPAPADGKPIEIATSYPGERVISGLALGPCDSVFVADTAHDRILYVDGHDGARAWLPAHTDAALEAPGHFASPRGLAVAPDGLWVADHGHGRLQKLAFPRLEANSATTTVRAPTAIAADAQGRLLVVDAAERRLQRILPSGELDTVFHARLAAPHALTVSESGEILVCDTSANQVFVLDSEGRELRSLRGASDWLPGALACAGARIYVADAATGSILLFDHEELQGRVDGWRGPVSALAIGGNGDLYVKPGQDTRCFRLAADAGFMGEGELYAGPFDAGEDRAWERAWVDAELASGNRIDLDVALKNERSAPGPNDWRTLPSADALLAQPPAASGRFAWLRLRMASTASRASPIVRQVRLATAAEDYLDHLPLTYRRNDRDDFLARWLKLPRGEFAGIEEALELLPRLADPGFVPTDAIAWLAQWIGLDLPAIADDEARRGLIARAADLFARRGTPASIAQFIALNTGVRPMIIEAFDERRVWVLGVSSRLDFDTRLAQLDPMGLVVPDADAGACGTGAIGRAIVGAAGPLASYQIGMPLYVDEAYRFCVVVDACRLRQPGLLDELRRIIDREKPAHTDYRVDVIAPELRIGLQARVGIDTIVGDEQAGGLVDARLGVESRLAADGVARVGTARLDGGLTLS
jgi:phage tail-like protein